MRLKNKFILVVLLLLIGVTNVNVSFVSSQQSLKIQVYYIDGSQVFDEQRANYLISYGYVLSRSELLKSIDKLSEWDLKDPMLNKYARFLGYESGLTEQLLNLFNKSGNVFINIFVVNDVIRIVTSDYDYALGIVENYYALISDLYLSTLHDFLSSKFGLEASTNDLISYIGGSLKIVIIEEPLPGYPPSQTIDEKLDRSGLKPDFIGGYAYDGVFGYYHFLIYLSCYSEVYNYSYTFDEIYGEVDSFLDNLFEGADVPIILDVLNECIEAVPDINSDTNSSGEAPSNEGGYEGREINVIFVKDYIYELKSESTTPHTEEITSREYSILILGVIIILATSLLILRRLK